MESEKNQRMEAKEREWTSVRKKMRKRKTEGLRRISKGRSKTYFYSYIVEPPPL